MKKLQSSAKFKTGDRVTGRHENGYTYCDAEVCKHKGKLCVKYKRHVLYLEDFYNLNLQRDSYKEEL